MIKRIPKETQYFHFFNKNPKNRRTTDCVVRALATALNQSWEQTYRDLFEIGIKSCRPPEDSWVTDRYLESKGCFKINQPKKRDGTKFTGEEICHLIQENSFISNEDLNLSNYDFFLNIGTHHCSCIIKGKIHDIWNCSYDKVGKMWAVSSKYM